MSRTLKLFATGVFALTLIAAPAFAQEKSAEANPPETKKSPFLDDSHRYITSRADNLAHWMNNFFGDVRTEEEDPRSTVRMRFEQEVDEHNNWVSDFKVRGKVHLPKLNEKVSLLFSDEDDRTTGHDDLLIDSRDTPEDLAIQYNAREKEKYRVDFRVGLQSSLSPKTSVRFKYEQPFSPSLLGTFSEEALYLGGDGFASITRVEFDKLVGEDKIVQWHNRVDWAEDSPGAEWGSSLSWDKRLSEKSAYGYFVAINGRTEPNNMVNGHSVGVRYRQNVYSNWLFAEVQPSYRWDKPEVGLPREHGAVILFRLEAVFTSDIYKPPTTPDKVGRE